MEKIVFEENNKKYTESGVYKKLEEIPPACYDLFLFSLIKVARSSKEEELLGLADVVLGFAADKKTLDKRDTQKLVNTAVDGIFPILNTRDSRKVNELISDEYQTVLDSLKEIRINSDDDEIKSKCLFGTAILTFPGSKIIDGEIPLDS